jgi:peptide/nickel transport system substrate-binding protein
MEAIGTTTRTQQLAMQALFYENLDGSFNPWLATSQDLAADGSSDVIHLRKGVKFSDGTDWNAQALLFNFNLLKTMGALSSVSDTWKSLEVIDDYTFKITYNHWQNTYSRDLSEPTCFMISPTAYQKNGIAWMRGNMVGTGPFMQSSYQQDVTFKAVRNPNYWDPPKPYLNEVDEIYVGDMMTREALFYSGGADVLYETDGKIIHDLALKNYPIISTTTGPFVMVPDSGNATSPWANVKVRQAVEYAIDKVGLSNAFGYGYRVPAYQIPTPDNAVYNPALPQKKFDLAKAKQMMADAGFPNGFSTTLIFTPSGDNRDLDVTLQASLAAIGIKATLEFPTSAKFSDYQVNGWKNGALVTGMGQWPNYNADWGFYFAKNSNWWPSIQKSPELLGLIQKSNDSVKADVTLMQNVIQSIYNDELVIPMLYNVTAYAYQGNYIHDTGFLTRMFNIHWRPENAWESAH